MNILFSARPAYGHVDPLMPLALATLAHVASVDGRPAVEPVRQEMAAMPHPADVLDQLVSRFG